MAGNALEQVLVDHWANRINLREPDPDKSIYEFLANTEDIIEDVPPSYRQYLDLVLVQINFLIGVLESKLKAFAEWVRQEEDHNIFFYFL